MSLYELFLVDSVDCGLMVSLMTPLLLPSFLLLFCRVHWDLPNVCSHQLLDESLWWWLIWAPINDLGIYYEYIRLSLGIILLTFFSCQSCLVLILVSRISSLCFLAIQAVSGVNFFSWHDFKFDQLSVGHSRKFCATITSAHLECRTKCRLKVLW